jgi:hypothetical protein
VRVLGVNGAIGVVEAISLPSPSAPLAFEPQHWTDPSAGMPQA